MAQRSRKKSVAALRLLKQYYTDNARFTRDRLEDIASHVNRTCPDTLTPHDVEMHFNDKRYRESMKIAHGRRTAPRMKTFSEQEKLNVAWTRCNGECPSRTSLVAHDLISTTSLSYEDIAQWFGQQRYKQKHGNAPKRRESALLGYYRA